MTKRQAILAAIGAMVGIMSGKAKSEPIGTTRTVQASEYSFTMPPQSVTFSLDSYEKFTFNWKGESVTITGKEMFDALKSL